jgi:hypothetical protein
MQFEKIQYRSLKFKISSFNHGSHQQRFSHFQIQKPSIPKFVAKSSCAVFKIQNWIINIFY